MNPGTFSSLLRHEPDWNSWIIMRQQFWHTCTLATSTVAKTQRQNKCHHHHVSAVEAMCNTHMHAHMHTHTNTRRKIYIKNLPAYLLKVAHVVTETQDLKQLQKKEKKSLLYSPPNQHTVEIHIQRNWNTVGMSAALKNKTVKSPSILYQYHT